MDLTWEDSLHYLLELSWHERSNSTVAEREVLARGEGVFLETVGPSVDQFNQLSVEYILGAIGKGGESGNWPIHPLAPFPIALTTAFHPENDLLNELRNRLRGWRFYKFRARELGKDWSDLKLDVRDDILLLDGSNVTQVLHTLKDNEDETWEIIRSRLEQISGGRFRVVFDKQKGMLWPELVFEKYSIPLGFWPDGWKAYLLMLTALYTAKSLVFVEEPESFMHPELLSQLISEARTLSEDRGLQFIFTTHSTSFVNLFTYKEVCLMESGKMYGLKAGKWMEEVGLSMGDALATGLIKEAAQSELGSGDNRDN